MTTVSPVTAVLRVTNASSKVDSVTCK